jgi:DNA-binding CsgD family transcriptional regulator/tetratricopeptide (TPR) repeat protein
MQQLSQLGTLPLVGRDEELAALRATMDALPQGAAAAAAWLVSGTAGVGKTRLTLAAADEARRRGWLVASGRAFRVESGVPYALFADALLPLVRQLDEQALVLLTRGVGELAHLFPWLAQATEVPVQERAADFRARLHWHFTQFLRALAAKQPLLLVLEDLQWADTSSLELLHFVARHTADAPVFLLGTFNPEHAAAVPGLRALEQEVRGLPAGRELKLDPLAPDAVEELICRTFGADIQLTRPFAGLLFGWTRGNPFFIEETLKLLVSAGDLRLEDGRWTGWQVDALRLPPSVRDVVVTRLESLGAPARDTADLAAAIGARFTFGTLLAVSRVDADSLLTALDELCREHILHEYDDAEDVVYDFVHPLIRETLYTSLSRARVRVLHARIAAALEDRYGADALNHADELAYHFAHAVSDDARQRAVLYLTEAGRRALAKYANREAADYLAAALTRVDESDDQAFEEVAEPLARARQRMGDYADALALWRRVRDLAHGRGELVRAATVSHRMGLACYWGGELVQALGHFDLGLAELGDADDELVVRLLTAEAVCLHDLGRPAEALAAAERALQSASALAPASQARVHRTLLQLHLWAGHAELARHHGGRALELAALSGDRPLAFIAHWSMGVLEAFSGNAAGVEHNLAACNALAEELRAPVLRVWAAELALEFASARGEWDAALRLGEEAIRTARALQQRTLLPRLLVWTALIYAGRGDTARGAAYVEEAWQLADADGAGVGDGGASIHAVLAAYIGRTSIHFARGDYAAAIRTGEEGVALADRTGYVLWAVHRLLPLVAESYLWLRDLDGARRTGERLRRDALQLGHRLALGWANACDACVVWLGGDSHGGAVLMRRAADELESLPFLADATRLRRQLAGRLAEIGDRDGALAELRIVHDRLLRLGAEPELRKARLQFREVGARPPARGAARGPDGLHRQSGVQGTHGATRGVNGAGATITARELAITELVSQRKSSKAIARELNISVRTVDAHLTNIYRKLDISSRAELVDLFRSGSLHAPGVAPAAPAALAAAPRRR